MNFSLVLASQFTECWPEKKILHLTPANLALASSLFQLVPKIRGSYGWVKRWVEKVELGVSDRGEDRRVDLGGDDLLHEFR